MDCLPFTNDATSDQLPLKTMKDVWQCIYQTELLSFYTQMIAQVSNHQQQTSPPGDSGSWSLLSSSTTDPQDEPINLCLRDNTSIHQSASNLMESLFQITNNEPSLTTDSHHSINSHFQAKCGSNELTMSLQELQLQSLKQHYKQALLTTNFGKDQVKSLDRSFEVASPENRIPFYSSYEQPSQLYTSTPVHSSRESHEGHLIVSKMPALSRSPSQWPQHNEVPLNRQTQPRDSKTSDSSLPCLPRRRRVGWRGVAMCHACGRVFTGMDQLNAHYEATHSHLLAMEWQMTQCTNSKSSKILFQAQLDRLRSEKAMQSKKNITESSGNDSFTPDQWDQPPPTSRRRLKTCSESVQEFQNVSSAQSTNSTDPLSLELPLSPDKVDIEHTFPLSINTTEIPANDAVHLVKANIDTTVHPTISDNPRTGKMYQCPRCTYTAKWPTELQKHVMVHADSRPFVCSVCSTSYKWSWDLGRHFSNAHPSLLNPYKRQMGSNKRSDLVTMSGKVVSLSQRRRSLPI